MFSNDSLHCSSKVYTPIISIVGCHEYKLDNEGTRQFAPDCFPGIDFLLLIYLQLCLFKSSILYGLNLKPVLGGRVFVFITCTSCESITANIRRGKMLI